MPRIGIIVGSTRPNRLSTTVAARVAEALAATGDLDVIDLAEVNLPFYDEPLPAAAGQPAHEHTKAWAARIEALDAVVLVTPEYNASIPAVLKNAIDFLYSPWHDLPVGVVGYGWYAGSRVIAALEPVLANVKARPLGTVGFTFGHHLSPAGEWAPDESVATEVKAALADLAAAVAAATKDAAA